MSTKRKAKAQRTLWEGMVDLDVRSLWEGTTFEVFLLRLVEQEMMDRERRATERRIQAAKFPVSKGLETFNFLAIPTVNKKLVVELARCEWIHRRENVLALGNSDPATFCTSSLHC